MARSSTLSIAADRFVRATNILLTSSKSPVATPSAFGTGTGQQPGHSTLAFTSTPASQQRQCRQVTVRIAEHSTAGEGSAAAEVPRGQQPIATAFASQDRFASLR